MRKSMFRELGEGVLICGPPRESEPTTTMTTMRRHLVWCFRCVLYHGPELVTLSGPAVHVLCWLIKSYRRVLHTFALMLLTPKLRTLSSSEAPKSQ